MATSDSDLTVEDIRTLEEDSVFIGSTNRGKRTVSGTSLSPPDSQFSGDLSIPSSNTSNSIHYKSFNSSTDFALDLPETVLSAATLEFIGFTPQTATLIFERFTSRPDPAINPDSLLDYAYGHILRLSTSPFQEYSPGHAMTLLGLSQDFQDRITDPEFADMLGTDTLLFWIQDTLRIGFLTVEQLQRRLKVHASRKLAKKKAERISAQNLLPLETTPSDSGPVLTATRNILTNDPNLPMTLVSVQEAGQVLPGHIVLYRAITSPEIADRPWIQDDGSLDMSVVASSAGRDFNHLGPAWYWTPEPETAEKYRAWAERRVVSADTWVIRIQVPTMFITSLRQRQLWFSIDWKFYVWHCKKRSRPPPKFDTFWQYGGADLIKGHICTGHETTITRIKKEDVQTKMSEDNVLMISSGKATQWVFMQEASVERLGLEIQGKIHIEITASAVAQGNWRAGVVKDRF
jgi:hypothetical protein